MGGQQRSAVLLFLCMALLLGAGAGCVSTTPPPPTRPGALPPPTRPTPPMPEALPPTQTDPAPRPAAISDLELWAIQINLDARHFSPGGIDGKWGTKSRKALAAWQRHQDMPATGEIGRYELEQLGRTNDLFTTIRVMEQDFQKLTPYPASWVARSQQSAMGYETIEEMMAERHHLYRKGLRALNPDVKWPNPPVGTDIRVPKVAKRRLPKLSRLEISLSEKTVAAFDENGKLAAQFPCSIAASKAKRPTGALHVTVWAENPEYTFDPDLFADDPNAAGIHRRLVIPPGPNNPVGVAWIGLDLPGYGIHGTPAPESISHTESHGCFRLTNWDATKLVHAVREGLPVWVQP